MFRTARLPLLRRALFLTTLQHTRRWSSSPGPDGQDPTNKKQQPTTEVPAKNSGSSSSGEKAATPPPPPKVEGKAPDTKSPTTNAQQTNTGGHNNNNNNNSSSEKNENIDDTFANDASIPKGFEAFYSKVLLSKMPLKKPPSESIARALTMSPSERALVMEIAKRERRKKTWRNLGIVSCLLTALVAYRTYQARTRLDADISNYTVVMVDLPSHTAVYLDEHHKILGARNFVDYHKFEQTCDPAKDIIISYSTYYPWVPMLLLCLLPVLALMHTGFNGSAKMAAAMVQSEKARFNFQREMNVATRLKDVAGLTEAKREVVEVVDFLKQPERYQALGAKLPKGVLLDGPPGVGKTLLAKAVAGEAMVPFVSCSGSEFEEVYVGVGAQRVRELFREAHKCKPCVVFIDEIDAFGRKRKSDGNGSSRGTLNAFLSELDGFKDSSGIMVLAATNRSDILDNALTRSGRFDRKISLENPSYKDRIAIAAVHLAPLRLDPNTSLTNFAEMLAALTPGCSGADIFNICNESAIQAAREAKDFVSQPHFHIAVERVLVGLEKSAVKYTPIERERLAYHEAGVVVLNWFQKETDPVIKTTILPRGRHRTGVTQKLPQNTYISTEARLLEKIVGRLGGYVAEERFFNDVSSSAADDLQSATNMAREMVCTYGMDPEHIGHLGYDLNQSDAIQKPFGPDKEDSIDHSVEEIVQSCLKRARAILQDHLQHTRIVAGLLVRQETLTAQELWYHLGDRPVMSKEFQTYLES